MQRGARRLPALALIVAAVTVLWAAVPGTAIRADASSGTASPVPDLSEAASSPDGSAPVAGGESHTVTLVTGDVVRVNGNGTGQNQSASLVSPREGVQIIHTGEDLYALPTEVGPMLVGGQLDMRLLNLSLMVREGFTDDQMKQLPVIVTYKADSTAVQAQSEHRLAAAKVSRHLDAVHGLAAEVDKKQTRAFLDSVTQPAATSARKGPDRAAPLTARPEVAKVWLDGKVKTNDDVSRGTIGADQAWAAGYDGAGQTVAVIDTGIDESHPDLAGQVIDRSDFVPAPYQGNDSPTDRYGHGTHVASIIAGTGAMSGGKYAGVAPKARLINAKVLTDDGYGFDSWIIAGMQWAASKAKIVNMSLGSGPTDGTDPKAQALNQISASTGALFVVAAGNSGCFWCVGSPGTADAALTVAATTRDGAYVDRYSSRGPRPGDYALKPEIAAPGSGIVAAAAKDSVLAKLVGSSNGYMTLSGTSMATPHVAASAAIVRQHHPDWTAQQIRDALTSTARPTANGNPMSAQGSGLVNAGRAVTQNLHATGIVNLGVARYPQQPGSPLTGTITYTNSGAASVTLDLTSRFYYALGLWWRSPDEWTPPAGAVKVEPAQVVVPAGGTAKATMSIDASQAPVGTIHGRLVATASGGAQVSTTVGFTRDVERHPLTVKAVDVNGRAPNGFVLASYPSDPNHGNFAFRWLSYLGDGQWYNHKWFDITASGTGDIVSDLPKQTYWLSGSFVSADRESSVAFAGWKVQHDQPREMTFDGRQAHQIQVQTERPAINDQTQIWFRDGYRGAIGLWYGPGYSAYQLVGPDFQDPAWGSIVTIPTRRVPMPLTLHSLGDQPVSVDALLSRVTWGDVLGTCLSCWRMLPTSGRITLIDAGDGSPAGLARKDLRGKVALINQAPRTGPLPDYRIDTQVAAAAKAGAIGVVFAVDSGAPIRYNMYNQPIWATLVTHADGEKLARAMGGSALRLQADANTPAPYLYNLELTTATPPGDGVYQIRQSDLATVQARYHAAELARTAPLDPAGWQGESHFFTDERSGWESQIAQSAIRLPAARTEYVTAGGGHSKGLWRYEDSGRGKWGWVARTPALNPGQTITLDPNVGPLVPGRTLNQPLLWNSGRGGLRFNGAVLGSRDGSGGLYIIDFAESSGNPLPTWPDGTTLRTRIFNGDVQVCDVPFLFSNRKCRINQSGQLRVLVDTAQTVLPNSIRTSTEWRLNFDIQSYAIPLVLAEYKLPVDLKNMVPADEHEVPMHVGYQPPCCGQGGPAAPSSWAVKVWATFDDGVTWKPVFDGETGDGWVAPEIKPPHGHNGFVGLRVQADDGQGNSVDQTIIRAYTLGGDDR